MKKLTLLIPFLIAGCSMEAQSGGESVDNVDQALGSCNIGYIFNGGNWQRKRIDGTCSSAQDTSFSFGIGSDVPLMVGGRIATYGTSTSGDRRGRFFIDQDGNHGWGGTDTFTKFRSDAQAGDQPFAISVIVRSGPTCAPTSPGPVILPAAVVGIKRGTTWYIDGNGNGVWDGTGANKCDIQGTFGLASDVPVPIDGHIATTRVDGSTRWWNVDTDDSYTYTVGDTDFSNFGLTTHTPFSNGRHGTQLGVDVYLNNDSDWNWSTGDIVAASFLPTSSWKFVGAIFYVE